jgi:hypothetical protein
MARISFQKAAIPAFAPGRGAEAGIGISAKVGEQLAAGLDRSILSDGARYWGAIPAKEEAQCQCTQNDGKRNHAR